MVVKSVESQEVHLTRVLILILNPRLLLVALGVGELHHMTGSPVQPMMLSWFLQSLPGSVLQVAALFLDGRQGWFLLYI